MRGLADHRSAPWFLAAIAFVLAAAGTRPFAGGWNDGSRLASVEALVERGTYRIDGTVFLLPPAHLYERGTPPYDPARPPLRAGTNDKLLIDGRYYSDKPPLVSLPLAAAYRGLMALGLPRPGDRPDVFAWVVAVLLSGTAYAAAVGCMWALGTRAGLPPGWRLAWLGAFAFATILPAYARFANSHVAQLGAVAVVCVLLARIADAASVGRTAWVSLAGAGQMTGLAYNLDYGIGPPLVPAVLTVVALRTRRAWAVVVCAAAMVPLVVAGHAINYAIGGDWLRPLNMHQEYLNWPGSPFDDARMTGVRYKPPVEVAVYALDLLFGKKGFLTHNLPLLLAATAGALVLRRPGRDRVELIALAAWAAVGWAMYSALSTNFGGWCLTIRWFVPFVVPGFWLLAHVLVERPEFRSDFAALSGWGVIMGASAWTVGPWWPKLVPGYWVIFGGALVTWGAMRYRVSRTLRAADGIPLPRPGRATPARAA